MYHFHYCNYMMNVGHIMEFIMITRKKGVFVLLGNVGLVCPAPSVSTTKENIVLQFGKKNCLKRFGPLSYKMQSCKAWALNGNFRKALTLKSHLHKCYLRSDDNWKNIVRVVTLCQICI